MHWAAGSGSQGDDADDSDDATSAVALGDAEREAANRERSARRARGRVRRYVVANGCTRMASLTFRPTVPGTPCEREHASAPDGTTPSGTSTLAPSHDLDRGCDCGRPAGATGLVWAMDRGAAFIRRLRDSLDAETIPYVLVPEYHRDGHVHLHLLLDRFIPQDDLSAAWGHGWVDVRKIRADGGREAARMAASYAAKYVGKTFDGAGQSGNSVAAGRHRYEVAEGWQPRVVRRTGYSTSRDALEWVTDGHGQRLVYWVRSEDLDDYDGPAWLWLVVEPETDQ